MDRRRFLRFVGGAATGGAGIAIGRTIRVESREPGPDDLALADATRRTSAQVGSTEILWSVQTPEPVVALTFDDGPYPEHTLRVLELLQTYGIRATFNLMGVNAETYPELVREQVARGHEIGNHTLDHLRLSRETPEETQRQIVRGREVIEDVSGIETRFLRPPWGHLTGAMIANAADLGYDLLLWSLKRSVPGIGTPHQVADDLVGRLHPGAILLQHDGFRPDTWDDMTPSRIEMLERREVELAALPAMIEGGLERGYRFTTVSELLGTAKEAPG